MTFGDPIFEIAVYRKSPDDLQKEYEDMLEKQTRRTESHLIGSNIDYRSTDGYKSSKSRFWDKHGIPYPYNQIIGWVVLIARHDQILAEYFKITEKRLTRSCRKYPVRWQGKAFAIYLSGNETNEWIYKEILNELTGLSTGVTFKGRYVDKKAFEIVGSYIDWRRLLKDCR